MAERKVTFLIGANIQNFQKGMDTAQKKFAKFGRELQRTGRTLSRTITAPLAAAGTGLIALQKQTGEYADELQDMAEVTGMSTDTLQEFSNVARVAGVENDALTSAVEGLTRRSKSLIDESGNASEALSQLGISAKDANGNLRPTEDLMMDIMDALGGVENDLERASLANQLLGRRWKELMPVISMGGDAINQARQEAHDLGLVLDGDAIDAADDFRQEFDKMQQQITAVGRKFAIDFIPIVREHVLPAIEDFIETVSDAAQSVAEWANESENTKEILMGAFTAAALGPVLAGIGFMISQINSLITAFRKLGAAATSWAGILATLGVLNYQANKRSQDRIDSISDEVKQIKSSEEANKRLIELERDRKDLTRQMSKGAQGLGKNLEDINQQIDETIEWRNYLAADELGREAEKVEAQLDTINKFVKGISQAPQQISVDRQTNIASTDSIDDQGVSTNDEQNFGFRRVDIRPVGVRETVDHLREVRSRFKELSNSQRFALDIAHDFTSSFGQGMTNVVVEAERLVDTLRDIGKLLASAVIQKGLSVLLTGGLGGSGFFGEAGGMFGKIFGVNDALVRSDGSIVQFHPDDDLLAMKDFSNLAAPSTAGGGQVIENVVNFDGNVLYRNQKEVSRRKRR